MNQFVSRPSGAGGRKRGAARLAAAGLSAVIATALAACSPSTGPSGDDGSDQDTVVIALPSDVSTVDMSRYQAISDTNVLLNMFDTLTFRGEDGENEPHLAESWETSADGLDWTLHIRQGVTFQNGDPLTAEDVAFSIMRAVDPSNSASLAGFWNVVTDAEATDEYTVDVQLSQPSPLLMNGPGQRLAVLPKDYFESVGPDGFLKAPIAAGPYTFESWSPGDELVMTAFDGYWGGAPAIQKVVFRTITDESARAAALRSGDVDLIAALNIDQVDQVEADASLQVEQIAGLERQRINFDTNVAPFDNVLVRQAINHAINVDSIVDNLLDGYATRIPGMVVPAEIGYNDDLPFYDYDPDKARELLAEAGYPDGFTVDFAVRTGYLKVEEVGQAIASDLAAVGITANIKLYTSADYSSATTAKTLPPMQLTVWTGGGQFNGAQFFDVVTRCGAVSGQSGYYCNPEIDTLITDAYNLWLTDLDAAIEKVHEAEKLFWDDAGNGFLYATTMVYGLKAGLDWTPTADGNLWAPRMSWS